MRKLPPGLTALVRLLPRLLSPPVVVYVGLRAYEAVVREHLPGWLRLSACLLALPTAFVVKTMYDRVRNRLDAARLGAVLIPRVQSNWPGALDKLSKLVWNYNNGYIAEFTATECEVIGNTADFYLLYESRLFTTEPEYVKAILSTQFTSYIKGPIFREQFGSLLGAGVFNSDGDVWKFHRTMSRPFFAKDRISDFDIFEKHAKDAIDRMIDRLREGYPVDMQDVASRFTLDSATEFLFGKDVRTLSAGIAYPPDSVRARDPAVLDHPANRFIRAFTRAQVTAGIRSYYGSFWHYTEFWRDEVEVDMKVCFEFMDPIIADAVGKKKVRVDIEEVEEGETFLEHLVGYTQDQTVIRDATVNILIAGGDTTASTLTFAVYMLTQHPDMLGRLKEEISARVGVSGRPTHDDMREMKYLRAFINEVLRLYPPVPFNVRLSTEAHAWPAVNGGKPWFIPRNTMAFYSVFLMHRRKDLWGPDAEVFDPDRFLDERVHKYLVPNPFIFLPFNGGPRICLGQQFAYHEVSYFLIRLLQSIDGVSLDVAMQQSPPADWAEAKGRKAVERVVMRSHLTMYVEGGLWVRMKEAN